MLAQWLRQDPSLPPDCEAVGIDLRTIADGDQGIYETAGYMVAIIRDAMSHPVVRAHAERAVAGISHRQPAQEVAAIARYVQDRTDYRPDPFNVEWLQTPWYILGCGIDRGGRPQLDCDDLTMLTLALAGAIGIPGIVRVVSTNDQEEFDHVLGMVYVGAGWQPLDLTGMPVSRWTRSEDFPV